MTGDRLYRVNVNCLSGRGVPFRRKTLARGKTADHAAIDSLRRVWKMMPGIRSAWVGSIKWCREVGDEG